MTKGNRQRANPVAKPLKVKKTEPQKTIYQDFPIRPLNTNDSNQVKDMFALSNNFAALVKQFADTEMQVKASKQFTSELKSKKIKGPLMIRASPNVFIPMRDMEKAAQNIKKEVALLEKENTLKRGQIEHRYEEYVDSIIRLKRLLTKLIGDKELTTLSGHRAHDAKSDEETKVIFKKEFDEMSKIEMQKLPEEVKEAIAKDKAKNKTEVQKGICQCKSCKAQTTTRR